jgi:hypothetical protein
VVVRIRSTALVVALLTSGTGCLTGLGLPSHTGGGGQPGTNPPDGTAGGGAAPGGGGGAAAGSGQNGIDGGPGSGGGASGFDALPALNSFVLERWVTKLGRYVDGTKWLAGDFDDDGRTDLAAIFNDQGGVSIDVWISTGSTFVPQRWATQQGGFWAAQKWFAADFDGDGRADLANVFNDVDQISIDVHRSTSHGFTMERWATRLGDFWDAQKWVAGDFDGDHNTDLANVFEDDDHTSIDIHRSTGSSFTMQRVTTQFGSYSDTQKWLSGHALIPGVSPDALLTVFDDKGSASIDAYSMRGNTLNVMTAGRRVDAFSGAQKWVSGHFSGSSSPELANVFNDNNQASIDIVGVGGGSAQRWATQQGAFWDAQQWLAGNFDDIGLDDLANVFSDNGLISIDVHRMP